MASACALGGRIGYDVLMSEQKLRCVDGDLLDQPVEVIVNAWNRNLIPWWLLLPQGISGAIKRRAGTKPFRELRSAGVLPLGAAALTGAGRLPFKAIIHVAGISHLWVSSEASIRTSVRSALDLAKKEQFRSLAFPLIGAGTGGCDAGKVEEIMLEEMKASDYEGELLLVRYRPQAPTPARG